MKKIIANTLTLMVDMAFIFSVIFTIILFTPLIIYEWLKKSVGRVR